VRHYTAATPKGVDIGPRSALSDSASRTDAGKAYRIGRMPIMSMKQRMGRWGDKVASRLYPRDHKIMSNRAEGLRPSQIAKRLGVKAETLREYSRRIVGALDCRSLAEADAVYRKWMAGQK